MRMHLLITLVGLATSFAVPVFAQQKDTVDPQTIEQIDAFAKKFDEAFDNGDAAALASLFTDDAVFVTPGGIVYGRSAIEKHWVETFQQGHFGNHLNKADQYSPHLIGTTGNEVWRTGEWSFTVQGKSGDPINLKGFWSAINVREGDTWKTRLLTFNVTSPPASAATK